MKLSLAVVPVMVSTPVVACSETAVTVVVVVVVVVEVDVDVVVSSSEPQAASDGPLTKRHLHELLAFFLPAANFSARLLACWKRHW